MEIPMLALFAAALLLCVILNGPILAALVFGYALFFGYGVVKGHSPREMLALSWHGVRTVKNILLTFLLIGALTAVWRASGVIAYIVYRTSVFCRPSVMLLMTFLLNALISFLTGTSFGTSATMGVICMTMANAMGLPKPLTGGAVLAGAFFGDRCSPVSTSALLVAELTKTDLHDNIRVMVRTAAVPFALSCAVYFLLGLRAGSGAAPDTARVVFEQCYNLTPWTLLPVAAVLLLSIRQIGVKPTLATGAGLGAFVAVAFQQLPPEQLPALLLHGFHPENAELSAMMSGGGVLSMVKVFCIVCLSSCYAGMFEGTGFLTDIRRRIARLAARTDRFAATLLVSILSCAIACNQTLAIMLTHQLCSGEYESGTDCMSELENSAVVIAALVPWCIAGAVPLSTIGAPSSAMLAAVYLWLLPIWTMVKRVLPRKGKRM